MRNIRVAILSLLIAGLLINLPTANWISERGNAASATAAARPFFAPSNAEVVGSIFSDGFESGDISAWSAINPEDMFERKSPSGLQQGEKLTALWSFDLGFRDDSRRQSSKKFTGIDSVPPSGGLNTITDEGDNDVIGVTQLGSIYIIDCATGNAILMGSIPSEFTNPQPSPNSNNSIGSDIHPSTGVGIFSYTEAGNKIVAADIFSSQPSFEMGDDLFFPQNDPNADKNPLITGMAFPNTSDDFNAFGIDSENDILALVNRHTGETNTIGPIGVNVSNMCEIDIPPKDDPSDPDQAFMSAVLEGESFSRFFSVDLKTGLATEIGIIGNGTERIQSFTIVRPVQQSRASCSIDPSSSKNRTGGDRSFDVTVFLDGQPVSGANVNVAVTSGPNQGLAATKSTNQSGKAGFTLMNLFETGMDTIRASGAVQGNPFSCTATVEWSSLCIDSVTPNAGNTGKNINLTGIFQRGDQVEVNGEPPKKVKYKKCSGNNCAKLVIKNGDNNLNQCQGTTPVTNEVKVFRPNTSPPIIDTAAFATCP